MAGIDKKSETELLNILSSEERDAVGYYTSDIAAEQENAMERYQGEPYGDEVEGQSQVVSHDVAEVIDWLMPDLIRIFASSGEVVRFEPVGEEDEQAAKQATEYVNFIFWQDNNGFQILHDWFKTALLQKLGVVKVVWQPNLDDVRETYEGQSEITLMQFEADPNIEIIEFEEVEVEPSEAHPEGVAFDFTIIRRASGGTVDITGVPPEEFLVTSRTVTLNKPRPRYVAHAPNMTRSDLISMGFDADRVMSLSDSKSDRDYDAREVQRFSDEDYDIESDSIDPVMQELRILEEYVSVDMDGDGVAEYRRVLRADREILENDIVDDHPFCSLTPNPMPYKLYGQSTADDLIDIQHIKTTLWRQGLQNMYVMNNQRLGVDTQNDGVNLDDLLTSRPGGIVRTKGSPHEKMMPLPINDITPGIMGMMEYTDGVRESRSGITKYNQGMDADTLNKTARGLDRIMDASQGRKELIARVFAETGFKDLFKKILKLITENQDAPRMIRLRGEWVSMDPATWNPEMDVTVHVGLGSGNKDQMLGHLAMLAEKQEQIMLNAGPENPLVSWQELRNTYALMVENSNLRNPERHFKDPSQQPPQQPQQPPPDPMQIQMQGMKEIEGMKAQVDMQQAQIDAQAKLQEAQLEDARKRDEAELKARTQIAVAQIQAGAQISRDQLDSATRLEEALIGERANGSAQPTQ